MAFILHNDILFSVRTEELPVFRLQRLRARTQPGYVTDGKDVLLDLYAADAEYSADALEDVYAALEEVSKHVLDTEVTDDEAAKILSDIAREEDLNGRIRRNVLDTRRAVSFLMRGKLLTADQQEDARQILRDIESLDGHTSFLFGKINFLMDATVGFININQNKIIKIFSVASVAMLPPTLIASIYGMNFKVMFPEIDWEYGYPFSLGLMVVSVVVPFWFFRQEGLAAVGRQHRIKPTNRHDRSTTRSENRMIAEGFDSMLVPACVRLWCTAVVNFSQLPALKIASAAATVAAMSASLCAAETKPASKADGAK